MPGPGCWISVISLDARNHATRFGLSGGQTGCLPKNGRGLNQIGDEVSIPRLSASCRSHFQQEARNPVSSGKGRTDTKRSSSGLDIRNHT